MVNINKNNLHSFFHYYGLEHLMVNLYHYIKNSNTNNEKIYLSVEKSLYNSLFNKLTAEGISKRLLVHYPIDELVLQYSKKGKNGLRNKIIEQEKLNKSNKIKWIGKVDYAIKKTSKKLFLKFEEELTEVLKGTNSSVLCVYDFEDFINHQQFIDNEIIKKANNTHPYQMYQFSFKKTDN